MAWSVPAPSICVALVSPWLWFVMRFTRQFPVYYCCVQAVPDKINQCLWIIAGEYLRRRSAAECVYPGLFTGAAQWAPCDANNTLQKVPLTTDPGLLWWRCVSPLVLPDALNWAPGCDDSWSVEKATMRLWGKLLGGPKPNFNWEIEEANVLRARRWTPFSFSRLVS